MGKAKALTETEKAKIDAFKTAGKSNREISVLLGCSKDAINRYINFKDQIVQKKKTGPQPKLTERDKRRIIAAAAQTTKGCRRIAAEVTPGVSKNTVYRALKASPHLVREQMQKTPKLKECHKEARYEFADRHLTWTSEWSNIKLLFLRILFFY